MKVLRIIGIVVIVAAVLAGIWLGYVRWQEQARRVQEPLPTVEAKPKATSSDLVVTPDPELIEVDAFRKELRALALARNWAGLDAKAEESRKSKARFSGGAWKIRHFYESVNPFQSIAPWVEASRQWTLQRPQSITAHVAHADALLAYAWAARGEADAKKMTPEVVKLFKDQLEEAWEVLEKAKALPEKDPYWWSVALTAGANLEFERERYDQLYEEAVAFEPGFFDYYLQKARYLLPRSHGAEGDWERFAEEAAQKSGEPGKEVYARIVAEMAGLHKDVFSETAVSWDLTKAGFEDLLQKYPESLYWRSMYGLFACRNKDREVARKVFKELNGRVVLSVWRQHETFVECLDWAFAGGDTQ